MSKQGVFLPIHNFSGLKSLANNAKIRTSLKFLLIQYKDWIVFYAILAISLPYNSGHFIKK